RCAANGCRRGHCAVERKSGAITRVGAGNCGSIIGEGNKVEKQNTLALNSGWIAALAVIERDVEFCCKLDGIERAAREKTVANLNGGNFSAAVVDAENQILCVWIVFNIN